MRILHQSELATVVCGDATDPAVIDAAPTYDLLCTDPPYGVRWQSGNRTDRFDVLAGDDGSLDVPAVLGAWVRRLRDHRHVYVFGYRPDQLAEPLQLGGTAVLIWDKGQISGGDLRLPWAPGHEPITFGVYVSSQAHRAKGYGNLAARLRRLTVIEVPRLHGRQVKRHPTEKPVALMRQLVESSSLPGEIVLDPFAGCGSTLVAAVLEGRRAYGVEVDERYATTAVERVKRAEAIARMIITA